MQPLLRGHVPPPAGGDHLDSPSSTIYHYSLIILCWLGSDIQGTGDKKKGCIFNDVMNSLYYLFFIAGKLINSSEYRIVGI